jgi:hypothetical protein
MRSAETAREGRADRCAEQRDGAVLATTARTLWFVPTLTLQGRLAAPRSVVGVMQRKISE